VVADHGAGAKSQHAAQTWGLGERWVDKRLNALRIGITGKLVEHAWGMMVRSHPAWDVQLRARGKDLAMLPIGYQAQNRTDHVSQRWCR
jgi:hypothetical protein